jgi:hypothetical protein
MHLTGGRSFEQAFLANVSGKSDKKSKHKQKHRHHDKESAAKPTSDPNSLAALLAPQTDALASRSLRGSAVEASYHQANILHFLEQRAEAGKPAVSEEEISREVGVDIRRIPKLLRTLRINPHVLYQDQLYSWRGSLDTLITDVNQLRDVLRQVRYVKTSELKGSYKGYEKDLKQLREEGVIGEFTAITPKEKLYFFYDPELKKHRAPEKFRAIWETTKIEQSEKDRELN